MKPMLRYTFSIVLLLVGLSNTAQSQDSTAVSGLEIAIDYGKILTLATDFESKWEATIGYRYKSRVSIQLDFGMATLEPKNAFENGTFKSEGVYGTAALNYILPIDATNLLYIGLGYGISNYEDTYTYTIGSPIWADFSDTEKRTDLQADWYTLTIGSEKRLGLNGFYLGGKFSLRKLNSYDEHEPVDTYTIPGYGRTADSIAPAFNLYIKFIF